MVMTCVIVASQLLQVGDQEISEKRLAAAILHLLDRTHPAFLECWKAQRWRFEQPAPHTDRHHYIFKHVQQLEY